MYPLNRNRRLRSTSSIRSLMKEYHLSPNDFIVPLFIVEGKGVKDPIPSMPGYFRLSLDLIEKKVASMWAKGLKA
ncbi:MAG: porphobilinogen synthase, partial [Flavobacteriaceae bacterium]